MKNLIQYAPAFVAIGCKLNLNSSTFSLEIVEEPRNKKLRTIIRQALDDITLFENTSNFEDGSSAVWLAEYLDGEPNPLPQTMRLNVLNSLGIMKGDKYIQQALQAAKTNRSWHVSEKEGECTFFGNLCTHRGIKIDPHKRGRRSEREPSDYHKLTSKGISREQLVTPNLQTFYDSIPETVTVSNAESNEISRTLEKLRSLSKEHLQEIIVAAQGALVDGKRIHT